MEIEKKYNHIFAKIAIVVYIVAVTLIVIGFVKTFNNAANFSPVLDNDSLFGPSMNDDTTIRVEFDNGFDFAIFFVLGGFGMFIGTVLMIIDVIKSRKTIAAGLFGFSSKMFRGVAEGVASMKVAMDEKIHKAKKARVERCEYCGTELKEDERNCPNCGANK